MDDISTQVHEVLGRVIDPTFGKPLGELDAISNLRVSEGRASLIVKLASPSEAIKHAVQERIDAALTPLGIEKSEVRWEVRVPMRDVTESDPVPEVRNVVLVMSGKGGVGKSTVAVNLALALKQMGMRVGLLDADMYGPSIPTMMGVSGRAFSRDGKKIAPFERFGVKLMSIGFLLEDPKAAVIWRGPMLHGALQQFLTDVDWGALDYLLLDLPPGTGDVALTLAQKLKVTGAVIVTTPQEVALQDVYKSVSMCQKLAVPVLGVVENMSFFIDTAGVRHELFGAGGGQRIAEFAGASLLAQVPIDPSIRQWGDDGTPIVQADAASTTAKVFVDIAEKLVDRASADALRRTGVKALRAEAPKRLKILR